MIEHVLDTAAALNPVSTTIVVGHQAADVQRALGARPGLSFVVQEPQLGTAHALLATESALGARDGHAGAALGRRPAPDVRLALVARRDTRRIRRRRHRPTALVERRRATGGSSGPRRAVPGSSKRRMRARPSATFARSTRESTCSSCGTLRRGPVHRRRERAAGVLPPGPRRRLPQARPRRGDRGARRPSEIQGINSRVELAEVAPHRRDSQDCST